ncbi:MAG: ATP-binding protein [Actinomycetota bacterium]
MLEREQPLAVLESCLTEARSGQGSVVLVAGEAGIGKTSLARAFCERHAADARVWWGACDALSTPRPLGPLYDIGRAAGGELAALMANDANQHERFSGFLDELTSPLRPVITVVEDVHWADDATRDLLVFVARRVRGTHAVVVVTYRDDEVGGDHPLRSALGHLATLETTQRVILPRLSEDAVTKLAGPDADPRKVYAVTGGNPFFVTEVLAAGPNGVPSTVSDAVLARAARLSAAARRALDAAAIVPDHAETGLVLAVSGGDATAVDEAEQAGLLHSTTRTVRFRHELARLAVEQAISATRQPDLHAGALAYLADRPQAEPARLAYHAGEAGDRQAVLVHAPVAGAQASRLGAHRQAAAHYESALRYAGALPTPEHAVLLEQYAEECTAIDREAAAIDAATRAIEMWRELGDVDRAAVVMARRAYLLWGSRENVEARAAIRAAVEMLENRPSSHAMATVYTYAADLHMQALEITPAIELGERAAELAEAHGDEALLARALLTVGYAQFCDDPASGQRNLARSWQVAQRSGDHRIVAIYMRMCGSGAGELRRYRAAGHWLRKGVRWCADHDLDIHGDYCVAWLARTAFEQGHWSDAEATANQAAGRASEHTPTRITALTVLGRLGVRRGDLNADSVLAEASRLATRTSDLQGLWPVAAGRAEAAWLSGVPERIPDLVTDTYHLALHMGQPHGTATENDRIQQWPVGELAFWLWRAGELDAAPGGAAEPYALQISGDWRAAAAAWEEIGCPYEVAFALADSDDPDDLLTALATLGHLGAGPLADLVAARLRERGVRRLPRRPTLATLDNPAGLTDRELEVLPLIADGRTNAHIANVLHISPRTVGHHVSAILGKLAVRSRRDVARAAREQGITPGE